MGDHFEYEFSTTNPDGGVTVDGSFALTFGPGEAVTLPGAAAEAIVVRYEAAWEIQAPEGSGNATRSKDWFLEKTSLQQLATRLATSVKGVPHEQWTNIAAPASTSDVQTNLFLIPTTATVAGWLDTSSGRFEYVDGYATVSQTVTAQAEILKLEGRRTTETGSLLMSWNATYDPDFPLASTYDIFVVRSSSIQEKYQLSQSFRIHATLTSFIAGDGVVINQKIARSALPSTDGERLETWLDVLPADAPAMVISLPEFWRDVQRNASGFSDFVEREGLTFPSFLSYREILTNGHTYDFEWNLTFCSPQGTCGSIVGGKRITLAGLEHSYVQGGPLSPRMAFYDGVPMNQSMQDGWLRLGTRIRDAVEIHDRLLGDVPLRQLSLDVAGTYSTDDEARIPSRVALELAHGEISRTTDPIRSDEQLRSSLVVSLYRAATGEPISIAIPTGQVPDTWTAQDPGNPTP